MGQTGGKSSTPPPPVAERRSSMEWLPPHMSELTVVLLGTSWSQMSCVGNLLLKKIMFNPEMASQRFEVHQDKKKDQTLTVVNTPDILSSDIQEIIQEIKALTVTGPHVFLLVLQTEDFTNQHKRGLQSALEALGEQACERSLLLLFSRGAAGSEHLNLPLRDLLQQCGGKHLWCQDLHRDTLLKEISAIV